MARIANSGYHENTPNKNASAAKGTPGQNAPAQKARDAYNNMQAKINRRSEARDLKLSERGGPYPTTSAPTPGTKSSYSSKLGDRNVQIYRENGLTKPGR